MAFGLLFLLGAEATMSDYIFLRDVSGLALGIIVLGAPMALGRPYGKLGKCSSWVS